MGNLHLTFDRMYCSQKLGEDFAKFVAFSEYMNFNGLRKKGHLKAQNDTKLILKDQRGH